MLTSIHNKEEKHYHKRLIEALEIGLLYLVRISCVLLLGSWNQIFNFLLRFPPNPPILERLWFSALPLQKFYDFAILAHVQNIPYKIQPNRDFFFCLLRKNLHTIRIIDSPMYRECGKEEETAKHFCASSRLDSSLNPLTVIWRALHYTEYNKWGEC